MQIQVKREALQLGLDDAMILNEKEESCRGELRQVFCHRRKLSDHPPSPDGLLSTGSRDNRRWHLHGSWESHVIEQSIALEEALRSDGVSSLLSTYRNAACFQAG